MMFMPSGRILKYYLALSIFFHLAMMALALSIPATKRTSGDVMVVDLADLPRSTDFLRPRPGILQGARPSPPPPRPAPVKPEPVPPQPLAGRVPDLPVNPDLPAEKEFPPQRPKTADVTPPPKEEAGPSKAPEQAKVARETAGGDPPRAPDPGKVEEPRPLRELTPSLGKMVLARREPGAGRGQESSRGTAVGTGGKASKKGEIVEERGGGAHLTSLNAPEIQYISYFAGIKRKIELVWQYPYDAQVAGVQGTLIVEFVIGRNGALSSVTLVRGSGHRILDDEALGAIRKAAPYDPIPAQYAIPDLKIRGQFIYEMHSLRIR